MMAARPANHPPAPQRWPPGLGNQRGESRIGFPDRRQCGLEIGFGVDMGVLRQCPVALLAVCETRAASLPDA